MEKRLRMWWAIASAIWVLIMINMSFHDLKYGLEYRLFHDRVEAAYQAKLTAYEQGKRDGAEGIRMMLEAAKRYDDLQFLSLAAKRSGRPARISAESENQTSPGTPQSEYERILDEIALLEKTYGKVTLRQYREQNSETEQTLRSEMEARLIVPHMREPRLAAVLFHMFASPLALLLALWIYDKGYQRLPWLDRFFRNGRRQQRRVDAKIE